MRIDVTRLAVLLGVFLALAAVCYLVAQLVLAVVGVNP